MLQINCTIAALIGAIAFGAGDFLGGCATLKLRKIAALCFVQSAASATSILLYVVSDADVPAGPGLLLAASAGLFHLIGVVCLYQGFSLGRIAVVVPVSAVVGLAAPVAADFLFLQAIGPAHAAGIGLSVVTIALIAYMPDRTAEGERTSRAVGFGIVSGLGYGLADICLGLMTNATAEGGLMVARLVGASLVAGLLLAGLRTGPLMATAVSFSEATGERSQAGATPVVTATKAERDLGRNRRRSGLLLCLCAGICDCLGQLGFMHAAVNGQISVAAALIALYPAITVTLAVWLLGESIRRVQVVGLLAGVSSLALLAS